MVTSTVIASRPAKYGLQHEEALGAPYWVDAVYSGTDDSNVLTSSRGRQEQAWTQRAGHGRQGPGTPVARQRYLVRADGSRRRAWPSARVMPYTPAASGLGWTGAPLLGAGEYEGRACERIILCSVAGGGGACGQLLSARPATHPRKTRPSYPSLTATMSPTDKNISLDFSFEEDNRGDSWKARWQMCSLRWACCAPAARSSLTTNENPRDPAPRATPDRHVFERRFGKFPLAELHELASTTTPNLRIRALLDSVRRGDRLYYVTTAAIWSAPTSRRPQNPGQAKIIWSPRHDQGLKVFPQSLASSSPCCPGDLVFASQHGITIETPRYRR